jgi:hypothetical protein
MASWFDECQNVSHSGEHKNNYYHEGSVGDHYEVAKGRTLLITQRTVLPFPQESARRRKPTNISHPFELRHWRSD